MSDSRSNLGEIITRGDVALSIFIIPPRYQRPIRFQGKNAKSTSRNGSEVIPTWNNTLIITISSPSKKIPILSKQTYCNAQKY
ncbi:MAG: hypothetical protein RBS43_00115 [Candidatus Cloacimonas sp.]|nr:hypothetical protein [Candidatus Cloacimonas sp.]